jgi:hypothetical protein
MNNNNFVFGKFRCKIDGYNNEGYIKNSIPKRLYIDMEKNKKCCFVRDQFAGHCFICVKEYKQLHKEGKV